MKKSQNSPIKKNNAKRQKVSDTSVFEESNQMTLKKGFSNCELSAKDFEKSINNCVRYLLYRAGSNIPIRKNDIQKEVLQRTGRNFEKIMTKAKDVLKNTYGYQLQVYDEANDTKVYILQNNLPLNKFDDENNETDVHKVLLMLILTHIFMSNNSASEASLFSFLQSLNIDIERKSVTFGDVKHYLNVSLIKQKYLTVETNPLSKKITYSWGPRSESTISKEKLLNFVCKIYKDKQPKSFASQYESAKQQSLANEDQNRTNENV